MRFPFLIRLQAIYVYSGAHAHKRTNAAFLLSAWLLLYGGRTPEQVRNRCRSLFKYVLDLDEMQRRSVWHFL